MKNTTLYVQLQHLFVSFFPKMPYFNITDIYIYIYNTCTLHTRVCSAALVQDYDSDDDGSDAGAADLENLVSTHALALFLK